MTIPVAYGRFERRRDYIFRTEAWLEWGGSRDLGMLVMINPGTSRLKDEAQWTEFERGHVLAVDGPIKTDPTMRAAIEVVNQAFPDFSGRVEIRNLFNLRMSNLPEAMRLYTRLVDDDSLSDVLHSSFEYKENCDWAWLGWGYDHQLAQIVRRKKEVFHKICVTANSRPVFYLGKSGYPEYLVGHVRPQLVSAQLDYRRQIVEQMTR